MFKKFITGIMAGIIVIAVVMTAGCVSSTIVADDEVEPVVSVDDNVEQALVEFVWAIISEPDDVDEPVWFVTISGGDNQEITTPSESEVEKEPDHGKPRRSRSQNEGFGDGENKISPGPTKQEFGPKDGEMSSHRQIPVVKPKPSQSIVTSNQEIITPYKPDLFGFNFNRDFGINEPVEDPWLYEWDFGIKEPVEGAGLEGDPWLYEPVEPTGTKAWFGIANHDEDEPKDQSVKFPGHQVKDSVRDEDIPRFGVGASDEASDEDEPEEDHAEDKPSVPEVVTDGRKEPTSVNPNTGADHRMNCSFNPNQAGHDGGAIHNPDKDRHADKGFDEGSFARAA